MLYSHFFSHIFIGLRGLLYLLYKEEKQMVKWLGDELNGGVIVSIIHTHYCKTIAAVKMDDGSVIKYLIKEKGVEKNVVV
jgi:hypothetical protein